MALHKKGHTDDSVFSVRIDFAIVIIMDTKVLKKIVHKLETMSAEIKYSSSRVHKMSFERTAHLGTKENKTS